MSSNSAAAELSAAERAALADMGAGITEGTDAYSAAHPELASIVSAFSEAVFAAKPADVVAFAREYFTQAAAAAAAAAAATAGGAAQ